MKFRSKKNLNLMLDKNYEPFENISTHQTYINNLFNKDNLGGCNIQTNKDSNNNLMNSDKICQRDNNQTPDHGNIINTDDLWIGKCISPSYILNMENDLTRNTSNNPLLYNCTNNITSTNNTPEFVTYKLNTSPKVVINSVQLSYTKDGNPNTFLSTPESKQLKNNFAKNVNDIKLRIQNNFPISYVNYIKTVFQSLDEDEKESNPQITINYTCGNNNVNKLTIILTSLINNDGSVNDEYLNTLKFICNYDKDYHNQYCVGLNSLPTNNSITPVSNINDCINNKQIPVYYNNHFYENSETLAKKIKTKLDNSLATNNDALNNLSAQIDTLYTSYDHIQDTAKKHNITLDTQNPTQQSSEILKGSQDITTTKLDGLQSQLNTGIKTTAVDANFQTLNSKINTLTNEHEKLYNIKDMNNNIYSLTKKVIIKHNDNKRKKSLIKLLALILTITFLFAIVSFVVLNFMKKKI